ncbi:hypothetical protein LRS10_06600 [Phenylobacterium sp. J426]|uniref:hypothetical protein n=1 Tax=Phenylobacterium sp. J426 TaxID=2898439 RepID=UPI002151A92A|nr:hypothetical protein [Phenylobacterium sp. J426]MCR5873874.1 hypothetical protein [Phenylobacterium sp. J426]
MTALLMKPLTFRRLTAGERALAAEWFGAGLDAARVRLFALPVWNRAFVAGPGLIVWPATSARLDFSAAETPLRTQAVFVHELTHAWQAQNGVSLLIAKLRAGDRPESYSYDLAAGPAFPDLNIEQQAMVVEHAFLASRGGRTPHAPELYANIRSNWDASRPGGGAQG